MLTASESHSAQFPSDDEMIDGYLPTGALWCHARTLRALLFNPFALYMAMSGHSLSATLVHSTATKFSSVTAVADLKMLPFVEYSVFSESLFYFLQLRSTARE